VRADKICVVENGQIVEVGQHDELMARDGVYRKLHEIAEETDDLVGV
jgi:ABC-type multidrug transport system fused ATPase/permease subunit